MRKAAERRIPRFAFEYLVGGIGAETCLARNRSVLDQVILNPQYITNGSISPDLSHSILGENYAVPFGVAPLGLSGLMWPRAAELLAATARRHNIPFVLSTFATATLEKIGEIARENAWFQLYLPGDDAIAQDLLKRAENAGYQTLVVTVDIPVFTRRDRDLRNGLTVPPRRDISTLWQILSRPRWAVETLIHGTPQFRNLTPYAPTGAGTSEVAEFLSSMIGGHVSSDKLKQIRDRWKGRLVIKGILNPADARLGQEIGADALIVSNHGGRQLDAARSAVEAIPDIRKTVGLDLPLIADGGVSCGLDIARMLACGADFVLIGRAFIYAVAALGVNGGDHVMKVLTEEFKATLGQLGCSSPVDLPDFRA